MLNERTELHVFGGGSVTGGRYCTEVILPHVRLFRGAIGADFVFMDDNARPHRTPSVQNLLKSEDITRVNWPAYFPDLNPIKHVWDALGIRLVARLHPPGNAQQMKQMLIEEWTLLPQELLDNLMLSIRDGIGLVFPGLTSNFLIPIPLRRKFISISRGRGRLGSKNSL